MSSKPPNRTKRPPLVPDVDLLYEHLWRQFINQPGVFEKLVGHLESVKKEDDTICEIEFPTSEDDFHPLSESSRISVSESTTASARVSLPPMSPRTPGPGPVEEEGGVFFMAKNIDLVPDRNIPSPVMVEEKMNMSAIKVPVIQYFQPVEVKTEPVENIVEVFQEVSINESTPKSKPSITNSQPPSTSPSITLEEETSVSCPTKVPTFYPPQLPTPLLSPTFISTIQTFFSSQPSSQVTPHTAALLAETLQLSPFLSSPLFTSSFGGSCAKAGSCSQFLSFWQANAKLLHQVKDSVRIFHLLSGCGRKYLIPDDFLPIAKTVLDTHKQLDFFRGPGYIDLHASYLTSVVAAIFFTAGAWRRKRMYFWQFQKLNFEETLKKLSEEEIDINFIEYFSYDQFYVFYVKFVNLDSDDDGELSKADLLEYEEGGVLTRKVVDRVWQVNLLNRENMDYWDWVIFVMADVDKTTAPALDYWFAVLDTDDDGLLSLGEMKEFYSESLLLLIIQDINVPQIVRWEDLTTQICDIINSGGEGLFSLMDLRKVRGSNKLAHLLDAFINIFNFIMNDENDVSIRSEMSVLQKYVVRSLNDLES